MVNPSANFENLNNAKLVPMKVSKSKKVPKMQCFIYPSFLLGHTEKHPYHFFRTISVYPQVDITESWYKNKLSQNIDNTVRAFDLSRVWAFTIVKSCSYVADESTSADCSSISDINVLSSSPTSIIIADLWAAVVAVVAG